MNRRLTSGDLAEQHGAAIAEACVSSALVAKDNATRGDIIQSALLALHRLPHPRRASRGFTSILVNALDLGPEVPK